jgi:hypothetical protein
VDADETGVVFDSAPDRRVGYAELGPGRVQVEFSHIGELASEDGPAGDLDEIDDVDDDDDNGDFRNAFDGHAFTRDDGVDGGGGKRSWPAGAAGSRSGPIEEQEREEER